MRSRIGLAFFASCEMFLATPAAAQEEPATWTLSGGFDLIELRIGKGDELAIWDASFSFGDNTDQVMLMTSGGGSLGNQIDEVDAKLLYGHTIGATTLLAGVRQDIKPHDDPYATVGVQGTIGTRLNWETFAFLSSSGQVTGEAQVIYQLPITQQLYLEPRLKLGWAAQGDAAEATRASLTEGEQSLRLRYRVSNSVNAYLGVIHERLLGGTRQLAREQGEPLQSTMALIGIGFNL